jgi:hypothetical protein
MKTLKLFTISFIAMILMASTCEPEPITQECQCKIEGKVYISFTYGATWSYNDTDERSGILFPCWYDNLETNQIYGADGVWYKTVWKCKN